MDVQTYGDRFQIFAMGLESRHIHNPEGENGHIGGQDMKKPLLLGAVVRYAGAVGQGFTSSAFGVMVTVPPWG